MMNPSTLIPKRGVVTGLFRRRDPHRLAVDEVPMNAIKLLAGQHREIRRLLQQLVEDIAMTASSEPTAPPLLEPDEQAQDAVAYPIGGEELRETPEGKVIPVKSASAAVAAESYAVPDSSERVRIAAPPPTELDGQRPETVPGLQFRDYAGHLEDGRTHVGLDAEQLKAQMYAGGSARLRLDSAIGSGRETTAGSAEQFDNVNMVSSTHGRTGIAHAQLGGTPFTWSAPATDRLRLSTEEKYARFQRIVELIATHMVIEEQVLYSVAAVAAPDILAETRDDERVLKQGLMELRSRPVSSKDFDARLQTFADDVEHHFEEEEGDLFPRLVERMGTSQLERLGERMQAQHATLLSHSQTLRAPLTTQQQAPVGDVLAGQPEGTVHGQARMDAGTASARGAHSAAPQRQG